MAYEKLGFVDNVTPLDAAHFNHMEDGIANPDWNQMQNRPFGKAYGDTLTWDGNTAGLESFADGGIVVYKISDAVPTTDELAKGFTISGDNNGTQFTFSVTAEEIEADGGISVNEAGVLALEVVYIACIGNTLGMKPGTYFANVNGIVAQSFTINGYPGFGGLKKIDAKYLPGANILYADEMYLHKTSDTTNAVNRITADELIAMFMEGIPLRVYMGNIGTPPCTIYAGVTTVARFAEYAAAIVHIGDNPVAMYSAEYTPPETTSTETE